MLVLFVCIVVRDMSTTWCLKVFFLKSCSSCRMLDDFSHEMDNTQSRLDNVMKKLAKVSHMTSGNMLGKKMCTIGIEGANKRIIKHNLFQSCPLN